MEKFVAKTGKILAVCISKEKGTVKKEVKSATLIENSGLQEDAHAGKWHRQVSLLGVESIDKMRGEGFQINFGVFAENITTEGIVLNELPIGTKLEIAENVLLEITQIGKKCHHDCEIKQKIGDCVMPKEGIFAKVLKGGEIKAGDSMKAFPATMN